MNHKKSHHKNSQKEVEGSVELKENKDQNAAAETGKTEVVRKAEHHGGHHGHHKNNKKWDDIEHSDDEGHAHQEDDGFIKVEKKVRRPNNNNNNNDNNKPRGFKGKRFHDDNKENGE